MWGRVGIGPFGSNVSSGEALEYISLLKAQLESLKEEENTICHGLGVFMIDQPVSTDILRLEKVCINYCY